MENKYWNAAFFDSRDVETINDMAAMARRQLICVRELQRDELLRLKMKYPHLTTRDYWPSNARYIQKPSIKLLPRPL